MNNYENQAMIQIKNSTIMMTNGYHHHNHHNDHTIKSSFDQNYSNGQLNHQINGGKKNGFCHHENEKISNGIHHNADDTDKVKQSNGGNGFIVFGNNGCLPVVDDDDDDNNDTQQHCPKLQLSSLKKSNYPFVNGTTKNGILKKYPTEKNGFKHSSISYYCSTATTATDNSKLKIKSTPDNRFNRYEQPPYHIAFLCYISYAVLILFGYIRDFMRKTGLEKNLSAVERDREVKNLFDFV